MKKIFNIIISSIVLLPLSAFAQTVNPVTGAVSINQGGQATQVGTQLTNIVKQFSNIANLVYGSLFVVALILFFWGVLQYLASSKSGDAAKQKEAYRYLGFGIIALTVMVSIWGIITFLLGSLGIDGGGSGGRLIPTAPVQSNVPQYQI